MLVQRDLAPSARGKFPPIADLYGGGTLDQGRWKELHDIATKKLNAGAVEEAKKHYGRLLGDAATVAGLAGLTGFDPQQVHLDIDKHEKDGIHKNARPGLNLSLERSHAGGHTGWVDAAGTLGVALDLRPGAKKPQIGIVVHHTALRPDKDLSMRVIRHEMVHASHRQLVLQVVKGWEAKGRKGSLARWLDRNKRTLGLSDADLDVTKSGVAGGTADTEVLAYAEGFMTEFHRTKLTPDEKFVVFHELLGAVETTKTFTWKSASAAVKREAIARLRGYHASLGGAHKKAWQEWVKSQLASVAPDRPDRKDFLSQLSAFM